MRDDMDFNIQFCQLVEKYPELYDYNLPEYNNRFKQEKAWELIATELKESVIDCKDRWKNVRGRYGKVHKAQVMPTASATKKVKDYYLGPHLRFLNSFLKIRRPKRKYKERREVEANTSTDDNCNSDADEESNCSAVQSDRNAASAVTSPTGEEAYKSAYEYFTAKKQKLNKETNSDADLCFFKSIIPDVMTMNLEQKRRFKMGVLNLMGQILEEDEASTVVVATPVKYKLSGSESQ